MWKGGKSKMEASIVIPCLNAEKTIGDQLYAIEKQQSNRSHEIIIADNGSIDSTVSIAESFRDRLPALKIVDASKHPGAAHARNAGAKSASGKNLLFCDADDVVGDGWIDAMAGALEEHQFVAGRMQWLDTDGSGCVTGQPGPQATGLQPYTYPHFLPHAATANLGVRRSIHDLVDGFDESWRMLEDTDYCWRIQLGGVKLGFAKHSVVHKRRRDTIPSRLKQSWHWGKHNVLLYKHYRPLGMPELKWRVGGRKWLRMIRQIPHLRERCAIENWLWRVAWNLGRVEGCLRYKVLAI
jgi:glycosyltransferase involved in cell wall biosynthesis